MDNKIKIPWYRFRPQADRNTTDLLGQQIGDFPIPRVPRIRVRARPRPRPQEEPVREPVDEKVREREPSRVPRGVPILDPRQLPDPSQDPGTNPYRTPAPGTLPLPTPIPSPVPNPRRDPGKSPGVNQKQPMPQIPALPFTITVPNIQVPMPTPNPYDIPQLQVPPGYKQNVPRGADREWSNNFISDVEKVAQLTGLQALQVYVFMRDYDYSNRSFGDFTNDARNEFGLVAGTLLATILAAKSLAELWGARATAGFTPMVKLDEDFMNEYFGADQQIY